MPWFSKDRANSAAPIQQVLGLSSRLIGGGSGPIGLSIGDDILRMAQLANNGKGTSLIASAVETRPHDVKPGTATWQRWVVEAIQRLTTSSKFHGKDIVAALPASELFIDLVKMPSACRDKSQNTAKGRKADDLQLSQAVFSKIKQKLPFEPDDAMIKYFPTEQDNILVIAAERKIIDRYLAVYENAGLAIKSIGVWPNALTSTYGTFFGRRKNDLDTIVMLLDIESNCTNVVICRHKNVLFARSIPIGTEQLKAHASSLAASPDKSQAPSAPPDVPTSPAGNTLMMNLIFELTACKRRFASTYTSAPIERLVFLSGQAADKDLCAAIAKQLEMPAQIGDCMAAVETPEYHQCSRIDRRISVTDDSELPQQSQVNWATPFGLSLS